MFFASSLTGSNTKRAKLDMITCDLECPWYGYCIICSYDVTGADFENSQYAFGKIRKELESSVYNNN